MDKWIDLFNSPFLFDRGLIDHDLSFLKPDDPDTIKGPAYIRNVSTATQALVEAHLKLKPPNSVSFSHEYAYSRDNPTDIGGRPVGRILRVKVDVPKEWLRDLYSRENLKLGLEMTNFLRNTLDEDNLQDVLEFDIPANKT